MCVSLSFPSFSFFRPEVLSQTSGHPYVPRMGLSQSGANFPLRPATGPSFYLSPSKIDGLFQTSRDTMRQSETVHQSVRLETVS